MRGSPLALHCMAIVSWIQVLVGLSFVCGADCGHYSDGGEYAAMQDILYVKGHTSRILRNQGDK